MVYLITYDLSGEDGNGYADLSRAIMIAADGSHIRVCESSWLIQSNCQSAEEVYDKIEKNFDRGDECLVVEVTDNWYSRLNRETLRAVRDILP